MRFEILHIKLLVLLLLLQACNNSGRNNRQIKIGETLHLFPTALEGEKKATHILITFLNNGKKINFDSENSNEIVFHANGKSVADLVKSFDELKNASAETRCSEEILSHLLEAGPGSALFCNSALDIEKYSSFSLKESQHKNSSKSFTSSATNFMTTYELSYESFKAVVINFQ